MTMDHHRVRKGIALIDLKRVNLAEPRLIQLIQAIRLSFKIPLLKCFRICSRVRSDYNRYPDQGHRDSRPGAQCIIRMTLFLAARPPGYCFLTFR